MTIEETVKIHYGDLMWQVSMLEAKLDMAYARIKELEAKADENQIAQQPKKPKAK